MRDDAPHSSLIPHPSALGSEAYDAFAYAYDQALGERFFRAARRLLTRVLERHRVRNRTHLDLACGSGIAIPFFEQRGFASTGVDVSVPMLEIARRRASRLVAGDVRALPLRGTFGLITSLYDSLNHLDDLPAVFREVGECMDAQSLFVFDMNDPEIYPAIWGMAEPFVADGPDFHLEIATKFDSESMIGDALVRGWAMFGDRRVEIEERHRQRAHTREEIEAALASASLHPIEVLDFDPFGESRRVKLFFICRAVS
jgi:SAM-dependent methyltransferase